MTARDFERDQAYFLSRHRLHTRLLHGWGIVCGLNVTRHRSPDCARRWVVVHPGVALDCCGRELVLERDVAFELSLATDAGSGGTAAAGRKRGPGAAPAAEEPMREPFLLCLRYDEAEIERVPALYAEGACDPRHEEANAWRERVQLEVCRLDDVEADCWRAPGGGPNVNCLDDCDDDLPGPGGTCLEPTCACAERVPLARIVPDAEQGYLIDLLGRRRLPTPPDLLTHIVAYNWTHGGTLPFSQLRALNGRLEVRFDRRLAPVVGDATGVGPYTFVVQYGNSQQDLEFLPTDPNNPPTLENDCVAVFIIDPNLIDPRRRARPNRPCAHWSSWVRSVSLSNWPQKKRGWTRQSSPQDSPSHVAQPQRQGWSVGCPVPLPLSRVERVTLDCLVI
jgi:hypothetical protein